MSAENSEGFSFATMLQRWDEFPVTFIIAFTILLLADNLFCKKLYDLQKAGAKTGTGKKRPQKSRWFALHTIANIVVCITAVNPVFTTLADPAHSADGIKYNNTSMFGSASNFPLVMIIAAHFYHMVMFDDLNKDDYFHHLMFIPTMGIPGLMYNWGPCQSFLCLFISGLPGGIEYFFLALSKLGFVNDKTFLKKVAALQNAWCRWPGIILASYHIYMGWVYGTLLAPWYFAIMVMGLSSFNAIFYGFQAISALTKTSIILQHQAQGDKIFENSGRSIRVNRPGS